VLEIPGLDGHGPGRRDLRVARRLHTEGLKLRAVTDECGPDRTSEQ
jgi:hypothetical protein